MSNAPAFYLAALKDLGLHETGENRGPVVARFIAEGKCGALGDPWCAIFANAKLETTGFRGTRSPSSQSFKRDENFVKLPGPALGCIVVCWRGSKASGLGHVGFYSGEKNGYVYIVGGNESDAVRNEGFPKSSAHFGVIGYYWPKSLALPQIGQLPPQSVANIGSKVT